MARAAAKKKFDIKKAPRPSGRPAKRKVPKEGSRIFRTKVSTDEAAVFRAVADTEARAREMMFRLILEAGVRWINDGSALPDIEPAVVEPSDKVEVRTRLKNDAYQQWRKILKKSDVPREKLLRQIIRRACTQIENGEGLA